jgi:ABC-2 type transport system ATP-binding protein
VTPRLALASALAIAATLISSLGAAAQPPASGGIHAAASAGKPRTVNACLESVPDPGTTAPVKICYTVFKPAGATRRAPVPVIFHSHGWGGSRTTDRAAFARWLDHGYAVLSFDQRGFGESGGHAQVMNPAYEGRDVRKLVRMVSRYGWVQKDGRHDPRLGAIGGSYGGGYQFLGALTSLQARGKPVFDALAPEITWYDLSESIAPEGVVRTAWALALSAASVPTDALPPKVYKALVEGAATGTWPDGSIPGTEDMPAFFLRNGPKWHVGEGRRLDIPVLLGQGTSDSLFNLQQGLANWEHTLTPEARRKSIFVAYNGGHVLPQLLPAGLTVTSDPCSQQLGGGSFADLARQFMDRRLKKQKNGLTGWNRYHLATPGGACVTTQSVAPNHEYAVGTVATTTAVGAPLPTKIADGPLRVAGSPYLTGKVTALGVENRAFYGFAIGTSPLDATLVSNSVLPHRESAPVTGVERQVALPSIAVDVPAGQSLFLVATPLSDTFVGMGSRAPGAIAIENTVIHLPVAPTGG